MGKHLLSEFYRDQLCIYEAEPSNMFYKEKIPQGSSLERLLFIGFLREEP